MPLCNEVDTGLDVTWLERVQTSNWSLIAREIVELIK